VGGKGSTRWGRSYRRAAAVEEVRHTFNLPTLASRDQLAPGRAGVARWGDGFGAGYEVRAAEGDGLALHLAYTPPAAPLTFGQRLARLLQGRQDPPPREEAVRLAVELAASRNRPGQRLRWWMLCPLAQGGRPCRKRVLLLYLPDGARFFGCRRCHRLTYRANREHRRTRCGIELVKSFTLYGRALSKIHDLRPTP
jgi:hypothetical protein